MKIFSKALVAAILCNAVALGAFWWMFSSISAKNDHAAALSSQVQSQLTQQQSAEGVKKALADTAGDRAQLAGYFLDKDSVVGFIEGLQRAGTALGVAVQVSNLSEEQVPLQNGGGTAALDISLDARGTWSGVRSFLALLEKLPYSAEFAAVTLSQTDSGVAPDAGKKGKKAPSVAPTWKGSFVLKILKNS